MFHFKILGETVDEVSAYVKKHDAFEKLLATQEEKIVALQEHGDKLLAQSHFESDLIAQRLAEVVQRRIKVKELCTLRKQRLDDALLYAQFVRDVGEVSLQFYFNFYHSNKVFVSKLKLLIKSLQISKAIPTMTKSQADTYLSP